jgi:hypothetical protein
MAMSRRDFLLGCGGVVLAACTGGSGDSRASAARTSEPGELAALRVPPYPSWPNEVFAERPDRLDAFARGYVREQGSKALDAPRFLHGWMPRRAFDEILDVRAGAALPGDLPGILLALHVSGYFGGVWLRGTIDGAQPGTHALAATKVPPRHEDFDRTIAKAERALSAARSDEADVIAYCRASLFPASDATPSLSGDGLAQGFGYNLGYLLEVLEHPPQGLRAPAVYRVRCSGALECTYARRRLRALDSLAPVERALRQRRGAYRELATRIEAEREAYVENGRLVWSSGLSVRGFTRHDYETLLDVSVSFLETTHATALAATRAAAERDVVAGRRAAVAHAAHAVWLGAYAMGLLEGRPKSDAPAFVV